MDTQAVIDQFNVCLKMEYAAVVQYHQHSFLLRGLDRVQYLEFFEEAGEEALGHAKLLGSKIVSLGGTPTVERGEVKQSTDLVEMLQQNLELERAALDAYHVALGLAQEHVALRNYLEDQIMTEQDDVWNLEKILADVTANAAQRDQRRSAAS
jgi:bacterioferritin